MPSMPITAAPLRMCCIYSLAHFRAGMFDVTVVLPMSFLLLQLLPRRRSERIDSRAVQSRGLLQGRGPTLRTDGQRGGKAQPKALRRQPRRLSRPYGIHAATQRTRDGGGGGGAQRGCEDAPWNAGSTGASVHGPARRAKARSHGAEGLGCAPAAGRVTKLAVGRTRMGGARPCGVWSTLAALASLRRPIRRRRRGRR